MNKNDARASAGLFVRDFAMVLAEMGHRVTVVTPDKIPGEKEKVPGVTVHWYPWLGGRKVLSSMKPFQPVDALSMISLIRNGLRTLDRLAHEDGFDHVMAMWAVPAGYLARKICKKYKIPFTTWVLGSDIWMYAKLPVLKQVVKKVLLESDHIYADGLKLAEDVAGLTKRPCPFMATSRRLKRSLLQTLNLVHAGTKFLFIGRYVKVKGVDILLEAMVEYLRQGNHGHLYMFGGGLLENDVRERASRDDLKEYVTVGGFANEETVVSYLDACDCLVIPSRMESIPVVLSDAVQMGKPVVVSDVGDMGKLLREFAAGYVVPPGDPYALASALQEMSENNVSFKEPLESLGEYFDIKLTAQRWLKSI